jgi:hypothetical protein
MHCILKDEAAFTDWMGRPAQQFLQLASSNLPEFCQEKAGLVP